MRTPVLITTDFPDAEETARRLGISPSRTRKLIRRADEIADRVLGGKTKPNANGKRTRKTSAVRKRKVESLHK